VQRVPLLAFAELHQHHQQQSSHSPEKVKGLDCVTPGPCTKHVRAVLSTVTVLATVTALPAPGTTLAAV
jgi:hypothetical protein